MTYKKIKRKKIYIPEAELQWRPNFAGDPALNYDGKSHDKNFTIVLKENAGYKYGKKDLKIKDLEKDHINVRHTHPKDPDEEPVAYLTVKVNYNGNKPPTVIQATERNQILLDDSSFALLQGADISAIHDMYITFSGWEMRDGKSYEDSKKAAYLEAMFVKIEDNPFADKYAKVIGGTNRSSQNVDEDEYEDDIPF